jgi:hypothetical protein
MIESLLNPSITRRRFLQATGVMAGAAGAGALPGLFTLAPVQDAQAEGFGRQRRA